LFVETKGKMVGFGAEISRNKRCIRHFWHWMSPMQGLKTGFLKALEWMSDEQRTGFVRKKNVIAFQKGDDRQKELN